MDAAEASWLVALRGSHTPYVEPVSAAIERSYAAGASEAHVTIGASEYIIHFARGTGAHRQVSKADPTRTRQVVRRAAAAAADEDTDEDEPPAAKRLKAEDAAAAPASSSSNVAAAAASSSGSTSGARAVLVFAPGAGGSTAKAMRELQDKELRSRGLHVVRADDRPLGAGEARWFTGSAGSKGNLAHLVAVAQHATAAHPGLPIFLCGASFGNRVCAEALRTQRTALPAACHLDALICCGYPLHATGKPEGADPRRAAHLLSLPATVHTLFVQGEKDEFLAGRGLASLRDTTDKMAGPVTVHAVPGGGHTVPGASGLKALGTTQAQVSAAIADAIVDFVTARA